MIRPVAGCSASFVGEVSERMILFIRLCPPSFSPGACQRGPRSKSDFDSLVPQLSSIVVTMVTFSFAHSALYDLPTGCVSLTQS